jgi:hypothetical protein
VRLVYDEQRPFSTDVTARGSVCVHDDFRRGVLLQIQIEARAPLLDERPPWRKNELRTGQITAGLEGQETLAALRVDKKRQCPHLQESVIVPVLKAKISITIWPPGSYLAARRSLAD